MTTTQHHTTGTREWNRVLHVSISNSLEDRIAASSPAVRYASDTAPFRWRAEARGELTDAKR